MLLCTNHFFSQANDNFKLSTNKLLQERITPHSFQDKKDEHRSRFDVFNEGKSRTVVNETILKNGFLLIERLRQTWVGSNWVNWSKITYSYDGNSNMTEQLEQNWDGYSWVNDYRYTSIYDGNNNEIERLVLDWDGYSWVNNYKYTYTYDGNNNQIEWLYQNWDGSN
jgi:hypothetical protein